MRKLDLKQGSPEWHAHRATARNASEAAAMLGRSPHMTRTQFLHARKTGLRPDVDPMTQRRFDEGHRVEAKLRAIAEAIMGEDLSPLVGVEEVDGIELSASFDGLTFMEEQNWECKSLNDELRDALPHAGREGVELNNGLNLPEYHRIQCEQQLAVHGGDRTLFSAGELDDQGNVVDERHCWYYSDEALRAEIIAGWKQADIDTEAFVPREPVEKVVAEEVVSLPAIAATVSGELTIQSNAEAWSKEARAFIAKIPKRPASDQEFANCDAMAKELRKAEKNIEKAKASALSQIGSVESLMRTLDDVYAVVNRAAIDTEKLVKNRKQQMKDAEVLRGRQALEAHVATLNATLPKAYMPRIDEDFAGCISRLKNFDSLVDAIDTHLSNRKIAANEVHQRISLNVKYLQENAADHKELFPDTGAIVLKAHDDLRSLVTARIAEAKAAEQERMLRSEISGLQQQVAIATLGRAGVRKGGTIECIRETLAETESWPVEESHFGKLFPSAQAAKASAVTEIRALLQAAEARAAAAPVAAPAAAPTVASALEGRTVVVPSTAPSATLQEAAAAALPQASTVTQMRPAAQPAPATLKLGDINARFGAGFTMSAEFLKTTLGIEPASVDRSAKLYSEPQFHAICDALVARVRSVQQHLEAA